MLGSIVSHLASPTQDGMKHPEMHKKWKPEKIFWRWKKLCKKLWIFFPWNERCSKLLSCPEITFPGGDPAADSRTDNITEWQVESLLAAVAVSDQGSLLWVLVGVWCRGLGGAVPGPVSLSVGGRKQREQTPSRPRRAFPSAPRLLLHIPRAEHSRFLHLEPRTYLKLNFSSDCHSQILHFCCC